MAKTYMGTASNDILNYTVSSAKISALGGNDIIGSYGNNVTIDGGTGDDDIFNYGGCNVSINGGDGNDIIGTVMNRNDASSGKNVTITGGKGNDYITSATDRGNLFKYNSGDGFDTVEGFNSNDTLQITDSSYSTMFSGNDFVVFVGNGAVLLKNSANLSVKIKDSAGKLTTYNTNPTNALGGTDYADIIVNTNKNAAVLGFGGNDSLTNYADEVFISGDDGHDAIRNLSDKVSIYAGAGDDYIESHGNDGKIAGAEGNDTIYVEGTGNTVDGGAGNNIILSDTSNGGNVIDYGNGSNDDLVYGFHANDTIETTATNWSTQTSDNNVIVKIGNGSITLVDAKGINPNIVYTPSEVSASPVTLGAVVKVADASKRNKAIRITGNALANSITGSSQNDTVYGKDGNDYLAGGAGNDYLNGQTGNDTLWGGAGNDTLKGDAGADTFIYNAGNDVIADYASGDKISLGAAISSASLNGADAVLTVGKGTLTVKKAKELTLIDANGKELTTIIGSATYEYDNTSAAKITLASGATVGDATKRTSAIYMVGNALANTMLGGSGKDSLYGKDGNDYLAGNAGNDYLNGQTGNDTLWGGAGNDTLKGDAGADLFIYSAGNDVIADYASGDKISLGAAVSSASLNGADAVLTVGKGTLTVKKAKELTLIDANGKEFTTIIGSATYEYDNTSAAKITLASGATVGDATKRTSAIYMVGNALANAMLGGSGKDSLYGKDGNDYLAGNAGNDYLNGQTGNDTLWGGAGADTFIYNAGEGKDIITDFGNDDLLQITGTFTGTYNKSAKTIAFKVGSTTSALTLKNFTATTFNINGDAYRISGTKLMRNA